MVNLYKNGVYLVNGTELLEDRPNIGALLKQRTGKSVSQSEAEKETIAYRILEAHNPVSYTHLDVYKRQSKCCNLCTDFSR